MGNRYAYFLACNGSLLTMAAKSTPRTLYAIRLSAGPSVFCPMRDRPVRVMTCTKCKWNEGRKVSPLPSDELRGTGYVSCTYVGQ